MPERTDWCKRSVDSLTVAVLAGSFWMAIDQAESSMRQSPRLREAAISRPGITYLNSGRQIPR